MPGPRLSRSKAWRRTGLLVAPALFYLAVVYGIANIVVIAYSLMSPHPGLENFVTVFTTPGSLRVTEGTLLIGLITTLVSLLLGFPLAFSIVNGPRWLRPPLLACVVAPFLTSVIVRSFGWQVLLGRVGIVTDLLNYIGGSSSGYLQTRIAVLLGLTQVVLPLVVLPIASNMRKLDYSLLRGANSLGAGPVYTFVRIYLPLMLPGIEAGCILAYVYGVGSFITPAILGGYGTSGSMLGSDIQNDVDLYGQFGLAAAKAVELTIAVLIVIAIYQRLLGGRVEWLVSRSSGTTRRQVSDKAHRSIAIARRRRRGNLGGLLDALLRLIDSRAAQAPYGVLCSAVSVLTGLYMILPQLIAIPVSFTAVRALVFPPVGFSIKWYLGFFTDEWLRPVLYSVIVSVCVAAASPLLGLLAAVGAERSRHRFVRQLTTFAILAPAVVPSVVAAVGFYLTFARLRLNDSVLGIVLAEVCLALPFAFVVLAAAVRALDPCYERAASSLGASPFVLMHRVIFPLIRPAILTAILFSFLICFDESAVSIFLSGRRVQTLPAQMFAALSQQSDPTVGVVGTLSMLVAVLAFAGVRIAPVIWRRFGSKPASAIATAGP